MINIAICDDEELFLQREKEIIYKYMTKKGYNCSIDLFLSGKDYLECDDVEKYDIVFLDVSMDEMNGIETAKRIRKNNQKVNLIFVTAYINYATEGYKVNASRYILKNNKTFELAIEESLYSIIQKIEEVDRKYQFSFVEGNKRINLSKIIYIESNLHRLIFHISNRDKGQFSMYEKLDVIDAKIGQFGFCRIHKSYLVNMRYAQDIERYKLLLSDGTSLNIAKPRYSRVKEAFAMSKGEYDD